MHRWLLSLVLVLTACGDKQSKESPTGGAGERAAEPRPAGDRATGANPAAEARQEPPKPEGEAAKQDPRAPEAARDPSQPPPADSSDPADDPSAGAVDVDTETCCCEDERGGGVVSRVADTASCKGGCASWTQCELTGEPQRMTVDTPVEGEWGKSAIPAVRWRVGRTWIAVKVPVPDKNSDTGGVLAFVDGDWREVHRFRFSNTTPGVVSLTLRSDGSLLFRNTMDGTRFMIDTASLRYSRSGGVKVAKKWFGALDDLPAWAIP